MIYQFFSKYRHVVQTLFLMLVLCYSFYVQNEQSELLEKQNLLSKDLLHSLHLAYGKLDSCRYELDVAQGMLWNIYQENGPYRDSAGVIYRTLPDTIPPGWLSE